MKHVYILWFDNRVDHADLISLHKTKEGAEKGALKFVKENDYGSGDLVVVEEDLLD